MSHDNEVSVEDVGEGVGEDEDVDEAVACRTEGTSEVSCGGCDGEYAGDDCKLVGLTGADADDVGGGVAAFSVGIAASVRCTVGSVGVSAEPMRAICPLGALSFRAFEGHGAVCWATVLDAWVTSVLARTCVGQGRGGTVAVCAALDEQATDSVKRSTTFATSAMSAQDTTSFRWRIGYACERFACYWSPTNLSPT